MDVNKEELFDKVVNLSKRRGFVFQSAEIYGGFRFFDDGKRIKFETNDGMTILITSKRSGNTAREQMY